MMCMDEYAQNLKIIQVSRSHKPQQQWGRNGKRGMRLEVTQGPGNCFLVCISVLGTER